MLEFYQSDEFRVYRRKVVKAIYEYLRSRIDSGDQNDFWRTQGALGVCRRILDIPSNDIPSAENLKRHVIEDVESVFTGLVRQILD